jgi:hypothetical protein
MGAMQRVALLFSFAAIGCGGSSGSAAAGSMPDATASDSSDGAPTEPDGGLDGEAADAEDASYAICPPILPSFSSILAQMLSTSGCGTNRPNNCHSASGASRTGTGNLLDFTADAAAVYAELLGPNGTGQWARNLQGTAHVQEVVPGDASASFLYVKLQLPALNDPQYGECMPPTSPGSVCPAAVDAVKQWIEQGAAAN